MFGDSAQHFLEPLFGPVASKFASGPALAEKERAMISKRTRDALAAAKARASSWAARCTVRQAEAGSNSISAIRLASLKRGNRLRPLPRCQARDGLSPS
jgi:hypothetical protein